MEVSYRTEEYTITDPDRTRYINDLNKIIDEVHKVIVGQEELIKYMLISLLVGGHILIEGRPGLGKTLAAQAFCRTIGDKDRFIRFQMMPDMMPSDLIGNYVFVNNEYRAVPTNITKANLVLVDEINRAPPKVHAALLQAMQEGKINLSGGIEKETYPLQNPFMVIATQNPIESTGVYPLAEAQIDRFLFKLHVTYPSQEEELEILDKIKMGDRDIIEENIKTIIPAEQIPIIRKEIEDNIKISKEVKKYISKIVRITRPDLKDEFKDNKLTGYTEPEKELFFNYEKKIETGASPRASLNIEWAAKVLAFFYDEKHVKPRHIKEVAYNVLNHRITLKYAAIPDSITIEKIIEDILNTVQLP